MKFNGMQEDPTTIVIKEFFEKLLASLSLVGGVTFDQVSPNRINVCVQVESGQQYLIGKQGIALEALQQIVSGIARKNKSEVHYRVDINNYQEEKKQALINKVRQYMEERVDDQSVLLWAMSSYERRVVHEYFLNEGAHTTQSEDFGAQRAIRVIKK